MDVSEAYHERGIIILVYIFIMILLVVSAMKQTETKCGLCNYLIY